MGHIENSELLISENNSSTSKALIDLGKQKKVKVSNNITELTKPDYAIYIGAQPSFKERRKDCADLAYTEMVDQAIFLDACMQLGVQKLLLLAPASVYPVLSKPPIREKMLLTGAPDTYDDCFSVAKLAGIKLCQGYAMQYQKLFIPVIHCNIYGIADEFEAQTAHVIPNIIHQMHRAQVSNYPAISLLGSGRAQREFLYATDFAEALYFLLEKYDEKEPINVGCGTDIQIMSLAHVVKEVVQYNGKVLFNMHNGSDGRFRQLIDSNKIKRMGWKPLVGLKSGIQMMNMVYTQQRKQNEHQEEIA